MCSVKGGRKKGMVVENFSEALRYLSAHIPENPRALFQGGVGVRRTKYLLQLIGSPQNKLKVIHIAGTSGKSSTSYLLSLLLTSQGQRTGLLISPHITDIRERIRINNTFIRKDQFVRYLNQLIPFIEKMRESEFGSPTYFEILTVLAFYFFWKENVTYAVIETGLGGLFDATNVVDRGDKICIITKLGLDHTEILGEGIDEITKQKVGIITKNAVVLTPSQKSEAVLILTNRAKVKMAQLFIIQESVNYKDVQEYKDKTLFSFDFLGNHWSKLTLGLLGAYQAENCSLALAVLIVLSRRDGFAIDDKHLRKALIRANFFGRLSVYRMAKKIVIIDAAHNEQKMKAFLQAVAHLYPRHKFNFLIAFKSTKEFIPLLQLIIPLARSITVTSFKIHTHDWFHESIKPRLITIALSQIGFSNYHVIADPKKALDFLLNSRHDTDIIITGSFYLISKLGVEV